MLQDFKGASIVHIYKRMGDKTLYMTVVLGSECGVRARRGASDMIFAISQLQKKCNEQKTGSFTLCL